jgi:hypothetical protein
MKGFYYHKVYNHELEKKVKDRFYFEGLLKMGLNFRLP